MERQSAARCRISDAFLQRSRLVKLDAAGRLGNHLENGTKQRKRRAEAAAASALPSSSLLAMPSAGCSDHRTEKPSLCGRCHSRLGLRLARATADLRNPRPQFVLQVCRPVTDTLGQAGLIQPGPTQPHANAWTGNATMILRANSPFQASPQESRGTGEVIDSRDRRCHSDFGPGGLAAADAGF